MKLGNLKVWLFVSLVTFSTGVFVTMLVRRPAIEERRFDVVWTMVVPRSNWEEIYFRQINAVAAFAGQSELRTTVMKSGDHEIRIWRGFGLSPLQGVIIRYVDGKWSAIHVTAENYYEPAKVSRHDLKPPKSGWDAVWNQLVTTGILRLPDGAEINCGEGGLDGVSVVIETNFNQTYRTYMYSNPSLERCDEARRISEISDLIVNDFQHDWGY